MSTNFSIEVASHNKCSQHPGSYGNYLFIDLLYNNSIRLH